MKSFNFFVVFRIRISFYADPDADPDPRGVNIKEEKLHQQMFNYIFQNDIKNHKNLMNYI